MFMITVKKQLARLPKINIFNCIYPSDKEPIESIFKGGQSAQLREKLLENDYLE